MNRTFRDQFVAIFNEQFPALRRYLDRACGNADLADDLAQEAFIKLYQRGSLPDRPNAWLITVAMNSLRNASNKRVRRERLLQAVPEAGLYADRAIAPAHTTQSREIELAVRAALDRMPEREQHLLLLRAEGYSYQDIAAALGLNEASVGTLLARAKKTFRDFYEDRSDAPQ